jgi:hypothetical protein
VKKLVIAFSVFAALTCISFTGCGGGNTETAVVEAPPEDDGQAMEGMSDDEYNAQMEASMNSQE